MASLFTYGTLMLPALMQDIIGRIPDHESGTLDHFECYAVKDAHFPAIIPGEGRVTGIVYHDLANAELAVLDSYESTAYERLTRHVQTQRSPICCAVYVLRPAYRHLLSDVAWDFEAFARDYRPAPPSSNG